MSIEDRRRRPDEPRGPGITPQAVIGLLVITLGALLMAGNLGWPSAGPILSYWPVGIVILGLVMLSRTGQRGGRWSAGFVLLVGAWLTAVRLLGYTPNMFHIWPLMLVAAGVAIMARAWRRETEPDVTTDQVISDVAIWSGAERRISSQAFRRAELTAVMGGIDADFREASTPGEAVIDVFVIWGGIQIRVPPDWNVSNQVVAIMGGASDKSTGTRDAKHRLTIRGFVLMGGIEVKT